MVWCVRALGSTACTFVVRCAAARMLLPAGSHSKRACVSASGVSTAGAWAYAGSLGVRGHTGRDTPATWAASGLGQLGLEADLLHPRFLLGSMGKSSSGEEALGLVGPRLLCGEQSWVLGPLPHCYPRILSRIACELGILFLRLCDGYVLSL